MIEFKGNLSEHTLNFYHKRFIKENLSISMFFFIMCIPACTFIFSFIMPLKYIVCIVFPIFFLIAIFLPYLKLKLSKDRFVPEHITINNGVIICVKDKFTDSLNIEQIKAVKDYGEYYTLTVAGFFRPSAHLICQKDLLTQGTIEEFEALFTDKIKKISQKK